MGFGGRAMRAPTLRYLIPFITLFQNALKPISLHRHLLIHDAIERAKHDGMDSYVGIIPISLMLCLP